MKSKTILLILISILPMSVFGHGEDKPGPHGGQIRMPGSFHTELLKKSESSYWVYLLDIQFKNPVVKDSQVELILMKSGKEQVTPCRAETERFICELPSGTNSAGVAELRIRSKRAGVPAGGEAVYKVALDVAK